MIYDQNTRDAAGRAADWLQANPTKHISGELALTDKGLPVTFVDPEATCFCALGRLGRELGIDPSEIGEYGVLNDAIGPLNVVTVYEANDQDTTEDTILTGVERGHPDGIAILRRIQNGEPL